MGCISRLEHDMILLWAASTTCNVSLDFSELWRLRFHLDIPTTHPCTPITPSVMEIRLKASKTDPFRFHKGISIFVDRTNNDLCPIAAMLAYIARWGGDQGPLFCRSDGQPLTWSHFVTVLQDLRSPEPPILGKKVPRTICPRIEGLPPGWTVPSQQPPRYSDRICDRTRIKPGRETYCSL